MSDITINNSSQFIEEEWLNLVKKYFPNTNVNLLKASTLGYLNEIMSTELKNNIYHRNFIYDELLLNTATTSKSIYNFAKLNNVSTSNATPAKLSATLSVIERDLAKENINTVDVNDNGKIQRAVISKDTVFTLNGHNFMLPYDVEIIFNRNITDESKYTISANYIIPPNEKFPYLDTNTAILKSWDATYEGNKYIFVKVDLYQLTKTTKNTIITNENSLYNTYYKFSFEDQLAYFNVYYVKNGVSEKLSVLTNNNYSLSNNEKYCYYSLIDNNTLEISFSSLLNNFKPEYGSKLIVDIYTSEGSAGNLGSVSSMATSYTISEFVNSTPLTINPLTDCYGGKDKPSLLELKREIIKKNLTRNAIVTELDLENFFNSLNVSELINNSKIKFVKKRNDVLRKIYGVYVLMRDTNNIVAPTRTIDSLNISSNQIEEICGRTPDTITIPERSIIVYDTTASNYFLVTKELELQKYIGNDQYLLYSVPYLINVNTKDYLSAKYYLTYMNNDINLEYKYLNTEIPFKFMINSFNITKNSLKSDVYKLSLNFTTNMNIADSLVDKVKIRGILKDPTGKPYGYFDFNKVDSNNLYYEAYLSSEKYETITDNKLNIYNSLFDITTEPVLETDGSTSIPNCYISEDLSLEIHVLYKSMYSSYKYGEAASMPDLISADAETFATACVFYNNSDVKLFSDMSDLVDSTVVPGINGQGLIIKDIPVVEYNYFHNNAVQVYRILENFKILLKANINKLECNTDIDLKFFNTHGPSKMMYTDYKIDNLTGSKNYNYLDRLDLDLNMTIYLNTYISDATKDEIQAYLASYIEYLNDKGIIAISNISRKLEEKFEMISFIEFNSINGVNTQKIVNLEYEDSTKADYVPEYVNIRKGLSTISNDGTEEKKYKYSVTINYK